MVQLRGGSGYCISAETTGIRCTTHWLPNLLMFVIEYCESLVTHCQGSVSHELHCWFLGDINTKPLNVPLGCISVSYSVVQNSSHGCGTPLFLLSLNLSWVGYLHLAILHIVRPQTFPSVLLQFTFVYPFIVYSWETENFFNKIHVWHTAKAKEDNSHPFELDAQVW
jgi:hypothetical protein